METAFHIPTIDWPVLMPVIWVFLTGAAALLVEMLRPKQNNNVIVGVSLAGLGIASWSLLSQLGLEPTSTMADMVTRDQFSVIAQLVMVGATVLTFLFSEGYLRRKRIAFGEFYPLALWATAGGMIMVGTTSLIMLFIGLEVLSISLYCLAGMSRDEQRSEESAMKYFLLGAFASAVLLFGISFAYGSSGSVSMDAFKIALDSGSPNLEPLAVFGLMMILIGLGFKAGLVPFHQWTPDVYQGAPTNVTAYMSSVSKVAAFGALYRILAHALDLQAYWLNILVVLAILTMTVGNILALVQKDVKRALGYSSVAHAGYILVGLLAFLVDPTQNTMGPVLYYFIVYSLMSVGSFAIVTLTARDGRDGSKTSDLNGLWKRSPYAAVALVFFMVSLIGIPPTGGFVGKYQIFLSALNAGLAPLAIALAINSVISTYYYWQIIKSAFVEDESAWTPEVAPMTTGLKLTCAVCAFGLLAAVFSPRLFTTLSVAGQDAVAQTTQDTSDAARATPAEGQPGVSEAPSQPALGPGRAPVVSDGRGQTP